ncbi:MAG: hypothetical protein ACKPKO_38550, partial [Candidatus Fonsibacter sp.]
GLDVGRKFVMRFDPPSGVHSASVKRVAFGRFAVLSQKQETNQFFEKQSKLALLGRPIGPLHHPTTSYTC